MQGTMLWFNLDGGYGSIETDEGERLHVVRNAFLPGHAPPQRCKGSVVTFERQIVDGQACAVGVSFVAAASPRRARMRHARGLSSR